MYIFFVRVYIVPNMFNRKAYKYLVHTKGRAKKECLLSYSYNIIIREDPYCNYYNFDNINELLSEQIVTNRDLHEVVYQQRSKPCLDIDMDRDKLEAFRKKWVSKNKEISLDLFADKVVEYCKKVLVCHCKYFSDPRYYGKPVDNVNNYINTYDKEYEDYKEENWKEDGLVPKEVLKELRQLIDGLPQIEPIVFYRHRAGKYSAHIIVPQFYIDAEHRKHFYDGIINGVNKDIKEFIDVPLAKSIGSLSMPYCVRKGFRMTNGVEFNGVDFKAGLLTHTEECHKMVYLDIDYESHMRRSCKEDKIMDNINSNINSNLNYNVTEGNIGDIITLVYDKYPEAKNHKYRNIRKGVINFDRINASHCEFCDVMHQHDNTFRVMNVSGYVYVFCQRQPTNRKKIGKKNILEEYCSTPEEFFKEVKFGQHPNLTIKEIYADKLPELELNGVTLIKAQKGLGKTNAIIALCKKLNINKKVAYLTFRRTLATDFKSRTDIETLNFTHYEDILGDIFDNRFICQIDSIGRIPFINSKMDLLILDEITSLIRQLFSSTIKNLCLIWDRFVHIVRNAKHIIAMDADINEQTINFIMRIRDGPITLLHNTYVREYNVKITQNEQQILERMKMDIIKGKRICVATNRSPIYLQKIEKTINEWALEAKRVVKTLLHTSQSENELRNVNDEWIKYDIVMYSPSIQAGVNFDKEHFDSVYGLFCNKSNIYDDCAQMMHRVRRTLNRYVYIKTINNRTLPCTQEAVHKHLAHTRSHLPFDSSQAVENNEFVYKYKETDMFKTYVDVVIQRNKSESNFIFNFMAKEYLAGARFEILDDISLSVDIGKFKQLNKEIKVANATKIAKSEVKLQEKNTGASAQKHQLMRFYDINEEKLTPDFVLKYQDPYIMSSIKALRDITIGLDHIHTEEKNNHRRAENMPTDSDESVDEHMINNKCDFTKEYKYEHHKIANKLVQLAGFTDIFDRNIVESERFTSDCYESLKLYITNSNHSKHMCNIFNKSESKVKEWNVKKLLQWVNSFLHIMYKVKIKAIRKKNGGIEGYKIEHELVGKLFDYSDRGFVVENGISLIPVNNNYELGEELLELREILDLQRDID